MQIKEIILYNYEGNRRIIEFDLDGPNIIVGSSGTGKSALIDIVEYCLGSTKCNVSDGVIRDCVSWYGLKLQFENDQMFIARESPEKEYQSSERVYFEQGDVVQTPASAPENSNSNVDSVLDLLNNKLGISPNMNFPLEGQTREPLEANIKHSLFYCFQQQDEIATKKFLFHKQSEPFIPQAIKDTLPYFLGAVQEDRLALLQELKRIKRKLKIAIHELKEAEDLKGETFTKAIKLVSEAKAVGLHKEEISDSIDESIILLNQVVNWIPEEEKEISTNFESLLLLEEKIRELEEKKYRLFEDIKAAETFAKEASGFMNESREQLFRLESIEIFDTENKEMNKCPICSGILAQPLPKAEVIHRSIRSLKENLEVTTKDQPKLRDYIEKKNKEQEDILNEIKEIKEGIKGIYETSNVARRVRDINVQRGRVVGRISLWLESLNLVENNLNLRKNVEYYQKIVGNLERKLDSEEIEEHIDSILNRINTQMTEWAKKLDLEHGMNPVRLDIKKLTVVVDREERPITLQHIGSAKNWLAYHIITYLALHKHFRENNRPVPHFLFLDQMSQFGYEGEVESKISHEDREFIRLIFNFIFDYIEEMKLNFQIIITEHAILSDERFKRSIKEEWTKGDALIPSNWYKSR